jgi:hypothetical protein
VSLAHCLVYKGREVERAVRLALDDVPRQAVYVSHVLRAPYAVCTLRVRVPVLAEEVSDFTLER